MLGPLVGTRLFARFAPEGTVPRIPGVAFFAAACLDCVAVLIARRLFARLRARDALEASATPCGAAAGE